MTLEEIPAAEQLMDLTREPSVPANLSFLFLGLIWPQPEALRAQVDKAAQADIDLMNGTVDWIGAVLKPSWVAPDLRTRLRAARAIISGQDAFLARYTLDQNKIQIAVTQYHVHIVIKPPGKFEPLAALHQFLQVDVADDENPWTGDPWFVSQVAGLTFGYQLRSHLSNWRDSIVYLTNGRAVKFSVQKIVALPKGSGPRKTGVGLTPEAERHWFGVKP